MTINPSEKNTAHWNRVTDHFSCLAADSQFQIQLLRKFDHTMTWHGTPVPVSPPTFFLKIAWHNFCSAFSCLGAIELSTKHISNERGKSGIASMANVFRRSYNLLIHCFLLGESIYSTTVISFRCCDKVHHKFLFARSTSINPMLGMNKLWMSPWNKYYRWWPPFSCTYHKKNSI